MQNEGGRLIPPSFWHSRFLPFHTRAYRVLRVEHPVHRTLDPVHGMEHPLDQMGHVVDRMNDLVDRMKHSVDRTEHLSTAWGMSPTALDVSSMQASDTSRRIVNDRLLSSRERSRNP